MGESVGAGARTQSRMNIHRSVTQMMAYQFFEDKGTVFSILDGARVEISHLDSQDFNPVAYRKHLECLKNLIGR